MIRIAEYNKIDGRPFHYCYVFPLERMITARRFIFNLPDIQNEGKGNQFYCLVVIFLTMFVHNYEKCKSDTH